MLWLYNFGILLYGLMVRIVAPFNHKAKLFIEGRKRTFQEIQAGIDPANKHIWFHFASLGEFEQGRPVLEKIKSLHPEKRIIVTFFSPSGYEIRKNYAPAEGVFYLPLDNRSNAERFIQAINPEIAIFTKYEFWHHYYQALHAKQIPLFLISGIFRPEQIFFKPYGAFYRNILRNVTHFFVQNEESLALLSTIGITSVSIAGDTRFDRVYENAKNAYTVQIVEDFCSNHKVFVAGSTWPQDEQLIASLIQEHKNWKFILAPHEIDPEHISQIKELLPNAVSYSDLKTAAVSKEATVINDGNPAITYGNNKRAATIQSSQTLIIDNIGLLSSLYQHADVTYIGGGFGVGIHNTLEAAAFG
ncbi:MAG: 3-deoxy-D-manno-octulosonic acid transferase, partial [Pedobacter sp.]|nr:3-deoxy-D-manno-octulosonic acid transferase [Pedobacter sp.]